MEGWIKLHRKIEESSFYLDSRAVHLWTHLLIKAYKFKGKAIFKGEEITVNPGQFVTGRKKLFKETGIDESKIQRVLKLFTKCHMIEQQTSNLSRLITVLNWHEYQGDEQQMNNKRTTNEQQTNTIKESKKVINKELTNKSENKFSDDCVEMKLSKYLYRVLLKSDSGNPEPNYQKWCLDFDYIMRIDKRSASDIQKIINYAHNPVNSSDKFSWIPNVRSPKKVREHFTTILLQCEKIVNSDETISHPSHKEL
jgi:hypothetical protein